MIHDISALMRHAHEHSLGERLKRMRPEIIAALRERGEFKFREGGQVFTIRLRRPAIPPA